MAVNAYPMHVPCGVQTGQWVLYITTCIIDDLELIHDILTRICSPILCKQMESSKAKYCWVDEAGNSIKLSTHNYTVNVLKYGRDLLDKPDLFDARSSELLTLYRRIYRIFAHALSRHRKQLEIYGLLDTVNSYHTSFTSFATYHRLITQEEIAAGGT